MARNDRRIIIHFDYDCFYASVFEKENPSLKEMPLAVQQVPDIPPLHIHPQLVNANLETNHCMKQCQNSHQQVTCNYEARRRGLHKLQLISEARKIVPDVVIVLGEELGRFRDASKLLYKFLASFSWNGKVERLGFDEVWMDVTDLVDYNRALLNPHDMTNSFFQLKQDDPTVGFSYNATGIAGHFFPDQPHPPILDLKDDLMTRLMLGSHLAQHIRVSLEQDQGYTSTVGISTNKILSKLVGNVFKPRDQTTLLPPYVSVNKASPTPSDEAERQSNISLFLDSHDIGKLPGIGFKMSQRIRDHILSRPAEFEIGLIYGGTKESVTVRDVRLFPGMGPELLEKILGGPGTERGIGAKAWNLINGIDATEVQQARKVPSQISIEDSYIRLDTMPEVLQELRTLATSLLKRMHTDLLEDSDDPDSTLVGSKRWLAHPKTLRLSTRPRPPPNTDGTTTRSFNRISRSGPLPHFIFNLNENVDATVEKLLQVALIPMFRRLHPQQSGWNLSLVNLAVTNLVETATDDGKGGGRDIGKMFRRQETVLKGWKIEDRDVPPDSILPISAENNSGVVANDTPTTVYEHSTPTVVEGNSLVGSEDFLPRTQDTDTEGSWDEDDDGDTEVCGVCRASMPAFAMAAHRRYHDLGG
ncbi:hypothetical protein HYFRA_00012677 [Hymenoscyphus fraxineus]|uniref:UmuC domain-containing protein n=1 Tax=Hymenoscyphus fraxineus TaxID=746836 RepID=A0A9N9PY27_9HELO|nr:hypothetical protein HYFRA_00012677 [Hymenoscyphus fraxineus]